MGWSGLLEISRGGSGPGLMGSVSGGNGQELEGHVEVACTAHASTGVRRLVKSVVRGIKVRVSSTAAHAWLRVHWLILHPCTNFVCRCDGGRPVWVLSNLSSSLTCADSHPSRACLHVLPDLQARQDPEAAREGMGGTYFFTNEAGRKVAIFKPCDEEPLAPANPKGYVGRNLGDPGWKSTVRVGEAAMREVAAYLLDHDHYAQVRTWLLPAAARRRECAQQHASRTWRRAAAVRLSLQMCLRRPLHGGAVRAHQVRLVSC